MIFGNSKGFSLVETMMSLSILGTISGATMMLINNQAKQIYYLEDRLTIANLRAEIFQEMRISATCEKSLSGRKLTNEPQSFEVRNILGKTIYSKELSSETSLYERINITDLTYKNIDVPSGAGLGWIEIGIHTKRQRKGGGPDKFAPLTFRMRVGTNTDRKIASCDTDRITALDCGSYQNGSYKTMTEGDCPNRHIRRDLCVAGLWLFYDRKIDVGCSSGDESP